MSFLIGPSPVRRTLNYLKTCPLVFREQVKVVEVHYLMYRKKKLYRKKSDVHQGLRDWWYWNSDPVQYNNKHIQMLRFVDMNPLPFVRCWLDTGEDVLFDCDSKTMEEIMVQLIKTLGKSKKDLEAERMKSADDQKVNPAIFGYSRERFCMCEVEGQVPCPGTVELPLGMRRKYIYTRPDELEAYENNPDAPKWDYEYIRNKYWNDLPTEPLLKDYPNLPRIQVGKMPRNTRRDPFQKQQKTYLELKAEREREDEIKKRNR